MPAPSVRRCTSRLSDSLCFPNARHSIRLRQSRRMYHVHRPRQHAVHPIGHDVLDGRPPVSTWQWRPARPHVLQHMTGLPPERRVHQRSSGNLKTRAQCSVLSAESHGTLRWTLHLWFHVKPAPAPGECHHADHVSPAVHVVAIGFTELVQYTTRGTCRLKQMHLPHSSVAGGLPSHRARPTHREVSSSHTAATSGWSSPATARDVPASGEGEAIASHPAT